MTYPNELTNPAQSQWPVRVNEAFKSLRGAALYAPNDLTTTGLTLGYFGGFLDATTIADGAVVLTDSATNYVVAHRTTGVVSDSTATTNWDDTSTYGRLFVAVTSGGAIATLRSYHRMSGGIFDHAGSPGSVDASAVTYTPADLDDWVSSDDPGEVDDALNQLADRVSGLEEGMTIQDEMMSGYIGTVADKNYKIVVKAAHGGTFTETTTISESGTATFTFKINSTALGGTANSVSSAEQSQAHASNNVFVPGDDIVITASANSSCLGASFTMKYTRVLS